MKKLVALLLVIALFAVCLSACSGTPANDKTPADTGGAISSETPEIDYPTKNMRMIIPQNAGGDTDVVGRKLASMLEEKLGVSVIAENLPGGNTAIGLQAMLDADADGYTFALSATNISLIKAAGYGDMDYTWFKAICGVNYDTCLVFSRADETRWSDIDGLVTWAKENPGMLTIGTGTAGGVFHLGTINFIHELGIEDSVVIPSTGGVGGVATTLLNGDIDIAIISIGGFASYIDNGDMVALASLSEERLPFYPDTPTMTELGYDITCISCRGVVVDPDTPQEICDKLEAALLECVNSKEFDDFLNSMYSVKMAMNSEEYLALLEEENEVFPPLVEAAGLGG